jgi:hypothetical protein
MFFQPYDQKATLLVDFMAKREHRKKAAAGTLSGIATFNPVA